MYGIRNIVFCWCIFYLFHFTTMAQFQFRSIVFPSLDSLLITADLYETRPNAHCIVLCHQAGYSRGEYLGTAILLKDLGYNCLAIDMRSGVKVNDVPNETSRRAKEKGLPMEYTDAAIDISAAIEYCFKKYGKPLTLLGSSYSASLALILAVNNPKVARVIAFSPGEYFKGKNISEEIKDIEIPVFVTSSLAESEDVKSLIKNISPELVTHFIPMKEGLHGTRVLWKSNPNHAEYWNALGRFLEKTLK